MRLVLIGLVAALVMAPASAAEARMPRPPHVEIIRAACPYTAVPSAGCTYRDGRIYLAPGASAFTLAHELGHAFDFQVLDAGHRRWFMRIFGLKGAWDDEGRETFADVYAMCDRATPPGYRTTGTGYAPTARQFRALCDAIRRLGPARPQVAGASSKSNGGVDSTR